MHLVFRLSGDPLRLFNAASDRQGRIISDAVVGGARASYYIREVSKPLCSVGAQLRPGAAEALFGVAADELADRHTPVEDLWGSRTASIRDQLSSTTVLAERLDVLERILTTRVPKLRALHPAVARALTRLRTTTSVHELVEGSGYSHRTFIELFSRSVGLAPKSYCRVLRFQRALRRAAAPGHDPWIDVAIDAGYSDQSHFNREFREFAGVTPTVYRGVAPAFSHHLPVD